MSLLGAALLLALAAPGRDAAAARPAKPLLPIQPESDPLPSKGAAGCSFGGRFYSLEDTWHPDLGEPFGIMHCVVCYCEPQRNRRGKPTGKVSCKNMKQDCPTPACADAILLPGHCCRTCPKAAVSIPEKRPEALFDNLEYFQDKDDDLHRNYNDRAYLSSEDSSRDDSRTDFVALLTSGSEPWVPASSAVAKARFSLVRSSLIFSISYERLGQPSRVRFTEPEGTVLFEHPVQKGASPQDSMICGIWRNLQKSSIRLLKVDQLRVSLVTKSHPAGEIRGRIIKHRALFAETFSAILTSVDPTHLGMGGLAMLTLSDTENNLHFVLVTKGLLESADKKSPGLPLRVQILHQDRVLREVLANVSLQEPDFAEVLTGLSSQEMLWLAQGQLKISVEVEGRFRRQIAGHITVRMSCDTIQSVLCGGDALTPTRTGAVGSAKLMLHANGTLEYQVQVAGTGSEVIGITLETKPRRRSKRNVLYDMTHSYRDGMASGTWAQVSGREAHMLLQNELFLNVATTDFDEGELRGQISSLLYSGLLARHQELPIPLAGHFVSPPVRTGSAGHAWVSLDDHCHLHYGIVVAGLGRADDGTVSAHLHGFAELGELQESSSREHKRLLRGFYGTEAQGVVKDLDRELFRHLAQGTAFLQVSTKANPRGEIRGKVHIPNHCEAGGIRLTPEDPEDELPGNPISSNPEELKKDPNSCFFEGQHRAHGSRWAPDYDKKCSVCSCQKHTVICDPVLCQPLNCSQPVHLEDQCCPVCEEKKDILEGQRVEKAQDSSGGCYFDGDKTWRGAGTRWHPVVPPFGLIKCAVCTCKGATGEVHCEKVQCPRLTCSHPVRVSPSDCCKQCPASEQSPVALSDMMQADGPRACRFGRQWYMHNESWHPTVPPFGEMKCITCWCVSGETHCQRQECSPASCSKEGKTQDSCCSKCQVPEDLPEETPELLQEEAKNSWRR
ncbi:chordin isoform X2 [Eublepharis macularius]|uniref:Chordin n=1 Tax=Eublepharis macularius TaxID=481883 RepID=A0AA97JK94_EUBMA|nr:chordin isoform X2 [Eublepharis macularius]